MAGSAVIGALRVVLGADTAALDKGLKDSQAGLASFGNAVGLGMAAVATGVAAAAVSIAASIKSAIGSADQLNKMSQSAGVSVEELSKLKYAADLADVSAEALGKSMGKLAKTMVSAATDAAGPAGRAFAAMGVDVKNQDGTLRSSADVMADLADKFSGYKDGAEKTALAIQIFGKAGAAMIPLLNLGRDGLKEAGDEASKFGLVLDKKTTIAAEAFNDNLKKMDAIKQGLFTTVAAHLLPAFEMFSEQLLSARSNSDFTSRAAEGISTAIKFMIGEVMHASTWIGNLTAELKAFWAVMVAPDWASVKTAWADWGVVAENSKRNIENLNGSLKTLWATKKEGDNVTTAADWIMEGLALKGLNREVMSYAEAWKKAAPVIGEGAAAEKNALLTFLDSQAKRTAAQMAEAATIGKSVGEQAKLRIEYEAQAIALAKKIALGPAELAAITASGDAAAAAAMKIQAANTAVMVMTPAEKFAQDLAQLQLVYQSTNMTMETFAARQQQIAEAAGATWGQASESIAGSFATISSSFSKESSGMAKAAKVFGIIQGTISMFTGAAKALELPFPANIAAVAAVLAKGASLVASIKGQSVPTGMMTGGSFTVPGSGGPDSKRVQLDLSPGEQVDVWRPEQGGGADPRRGAGGSTVVNLAVPFATTYDALRDLIERLNGMGRDGYRLNVVPA